MFRDTIKKTYKRGCTMTKHNIYTMASLITVIFSFGGAVETGVSDAVKILALYYIYIQLWWIGIA